MLHNDVGDFASFDELVSLEDLAAKSCRKLVQVDLVTCEDKLCFAKHLRNLVRQLIKVTRAHHYHVLVLAAQSVDCCPGLDDRFLQAVYRHSLYLRKLCHIKLEDTRILLLSVLDDETSIVFRKEEFATLPASSKRFLLEE